MYNHILLKISTNSIKFFFVYSINMPNINQNNKFEPINKEINLLQDLLKKTKKARINFKMG